jgi:hypothetical protein
MVHLHIWVCWWVNMSEHIEINTIFTLFLVLLGFKLKISCFLDMHFTSCTTPQPNGISISNWIMVPRSTFHSTSVSNTWATGEANMKQVIQTEYSVSYVMGMRIMWKNISQNCFPEWEVFIWITSWVALTKQKTAKHLKF